MILIRGELVWGLHRYAQFSLGHVDWFRQYLLEDKLVILRETKSNCDRSNRNPNGFFFYLFLKAVLAYLFAYFWLSVLEFLLNILWHIYLVTVVLIIWGEFTKSRNFHRIRQVQFKNYAVFSLYLDLPLLFIKVFIKLVWLSSDSVQFCSPAEVTQEDLEGKRLNCTS